MKIEQMLLTPNQYSRPQDKLEAVSGIVIHYVGNTGSTAEANRNYFEGLKAGKKNESGNYIFASSHYIVGLNGEIIQCIPESEWAYCSNKANKYTISIENCHPTSDGKFNEKTYASLVELAADICKRYKLNPLKDIIRHYDVTQKACPLFHVRNLSAWEGLLADINTKLKGQPLPRKGYINVNINGVITEIRADNIGGRYVASVEELARVMPKAKQAIRNIAEDNGYVVGWDALTETIIITG